MCFTFNGPHAPSLVPEFRSYMKVELDVLGTLRTSLSGTFSKLCQNWSRHWRGTLDIHVAVHRRSALRKLITQTFRRALTASIMDNSYNKILSDSWEFSETYGVTSYGSGWRKYVASQRLECECPHEHCLIDSDSLSSALPKYAQRIFASVGETICSWLTR